MPGPQHDVRDHSQNSNPLQLKESPQSGRQMAPPPFSMGDVSQQKSAEEEAMQKKESGGGGGTDAMQLKAADPGAVGEALGVSGVSIKQNSAEAQNNGAIAFARGGNEIHTAGSIDLSNKEDRNTMGEEFHHIKQQRTQSIQPTGVTEGGMPVNDDPKLEGEAKSVGKQMESNTSLNQISSGSGASSGGSGSAAQAKMADSTMQRNEETGAETVEIQSGLLTTLGEGNSEANAYVHWPNTDASGVTIGQGYDIGSRSREEVIAHTTAAGMPQNQAEALADGVGLTGQAAGDWCVANRNRVGRVSDEVQAALLAQQMPIYREQARTLATSTTATRDGSGYYTNARGREINDGVDAGTYVLSDEQWNALHPAMIEFLTDLKYQGGYYLYDRIAQVNQRLIDNHGSHIEQFRAIIGLFEGSDGNLSYMDNYGSRIGEGTGNTETFFDQSAQDLENTSTRRNRIRVAYLKKVLDALLCGQEVMMEGGDYDYSNVSAGQNTEFSLPETSGNDGDSSDSGSLTAIGSGTVAANLLNIRSGPGTEHDTVGQQLSNGESVTIYETQGQWLKIGSGQWVHGDFITRSGSEQGGNTDPIASGTVTATNLNVRSGPGTDNDTVGEMLPKGTPVQIYEESNGFLRIGEGRWVSSDFIQQGEAAPTPMGTGTVAATKLNVRSGPGTNHGTVGDPLPQGTEVSYFELENGWMKLGEGQWVSAEFINTGSQADAGNNTTVEEAQPDAGDNDTGGGQTTTETTPEGGNSETTPAESGTVETISSRNVTIEESVGVGAKNNSADVTKIQTLLRRIGFNVGVDGAIGKETKGAIYAFQYEMMNGYKDGRVDPGGTTLELLNTTADNAFANTREELESDANAPKLTHSAFSNKQKLTTDGGGQTIPKPSYDNMSKLIQQLNVIGDALPNGLYVNSGYRSPKYNAGLEGSATGSNHQFGQAIDISSSHYSPQTIGDTITRLMNEGKIHKGGLGWYNSFIHYDVGAHRSWDNR